MSLGEVGEALRRAGLNARALAAWAGTDRLSAIATMIDRLAALPVTPASVPLALFVAGCELPVDKLGPARAAIESFPYVEHTGDRIRSTVSLLPVGNGLMMCDRLDAPRTDDLVYWPDDSSYHLASSLPRERVERWADLGCGSLFALLSRPALAAHVCGVDLNARLQVHAHYTVGLSRVPADVVLHTSDLDAKVDAKWRGQCELVSCNAPIPEARGEPFRSLWHTAEADFVERLYAAASRLVAPGGIVVVHAALDALAPVVERLRGERVIVSYTPERVRGFAVAWWRPDAEARLVVTERALTAERPHLSIEDRTQALAAP